MKETNNYEDNIINTIDLPSVISLSFSHPIHQDPFQEILHKCSRVKVCKNQTKKLQLNK